MPGDFIDLLAWQEASALVGDVQDLVRHVKGPGAVQAIEQLISSAESVAANIAEGYGRGISKDNCRFQRIAIGSAAEYENRARNAVVAKRVSAILAQPSIDRARRARALTVGYLHWLERRLGER